MIWLNKYIFTILLVLICHNNKLIAQSAELLQNKYPGYNELILTESQSYDFSIQKNKLQVLQDNYFESIILSDLGIHNNSESFSFSDLVPLKKFDAYTIIAQNGREKKIPIQLATDKNARQSSVFYSDVKEKKLVYSNLQVGAKKVYSYQSEFLDPFLLHRYSFANVIPMEKSTLEIKTDKNIEIGFKIFNDPDNLIAFSKVEKKDKIIYNWTLNNVNPVKFEPNNPGFLYIAPHIIIYVKKYKINNDTKNVLGNVDQLFDYYKSFVKNLNTIEDPDLKSKTIELIQNHKTNDDKIKAIFYWVKDNIKYVAFENGYEGFIPREARLVNERKFGDCKDMSSIITEMAKYAEIPNVNLCWIGTRRIPYSYKDIATPAVDDHMIASYENENGIVFLDATDKETAFGLPTSFIQGKEALVQNNTTYKIVKVPVVQAKENLIQEKLKIKLLNNKIVGNGTLKLNGLNRSDYLLTLGDATNKTRFEMIKGLVLKGNNKFQLNTYNEENITNRDLPYIINFDFTLENYLINAGKEIYLNLFLDKIYEKLIIEKDRKSMFDFEKLTLNEYEIEVELPENSKIVSLPENTNYESDVIKYSIKYIQFDNKVSLKFNIENKRLLLDVADFELWNEAIKNLKQHYNENLVISTK